MVLPILHCRRVELVPRRHRGWCGKKLIFYDNLGSVMSHDKNRQGGYILVVLAFSIIVLLAFAAFAVDAGLMYAAHTSAQRAADAAALAGAYVFSIADPTLTNAQLQTAATDAAMNVATSNSIQRAPITSGEVTISFPTGVVNRLIQVDVDHSIPTMFAGVLGWKSVGVKATAFAEASTTPTGAQCVKPWFIPNNLLATTLNSSDTLGCMTCPAPYGDGTGNDLLSKNIGTVSAPVYVVGSNVYNWIHSQTATALPIRPTNPSSSFSPGNFFSVQLSGDANQSGGSVYEENVATCGTQSTIRCGETYNVKTGNMVGPTNHGVAGGGNVNVWLLGSPPDTWGGFNSNNIAFFYRGGNTSLPTITSRQLVIAPIWDSCDPAYGICATGTLTGNGVGVVIKVIGFAALFIDGFQGSDVMAHLVRVNTCTGNDPGAPTGPMGLPLRLVNVN